MKMKNAVIGARVKVKNMNVPVGYVLGNLQGKTGTIVMLGKDAVGMSFNGDDVIVRFDEEFNDDLWECEASGLVDELHWCLPVGFLKLK
jgi:hypothetical protein